MVKITHICDKCGTEETVEENAKEHTDYRVIKLVVGKPGQRLIYNSDRQNLSSREMFLCPICLTEIGINNYEFSPKAFNDKPETVFEKLYDLFLEQLKEDL